MSPLAKEHIRRNRQSRTFLVENVIGEIWSELEEGSVHSFGLAGFALPAELGSLRDSCLVPFSAFVNI